MVAPNVHVMGPIKGAINMAWPVEKEFSDLEGLIVCVI